MEGESKTEELPVDDAKLTETVEVSRTRRRYNKLVYKFSFLGKKYYVCPLRLINEDIHLLDKNGDLIPFDIKTVIAEAFDMEIKTFFNENNRGILTGSINKLVASPKYEHFINYSRAPMNTYITCSQESEPVSLESVEINNLHKYYRNDKLYKEAVMFAAD